ncbi:trimethylamine methyltransferase family protein [Desulforhopalus singaporensis]|uniref:Trimethylamine---corrinoid protein Co-methyltransferase n=1 Tax=Desulforhopalus singaporensis TaxID=91360 RepID=A0A1H0RTK5_9BACT|nr:trimethylamine methyltransferase family protein [Desulforhopalus singaporensis]SDP32288.1 trimethylamine---corrinoid protein Co-methyltransferase [Desulforhopalus singaporensis]
MKPAVQVLSTTEIAKIQEASLSILHEIGMRLPLEKVQSSLKDAGCTIDGDVVKIPPAVVGQAIKTAPKRDQVVLFARDPRFDVSFAAHDPALACMTMATNVIDPHTGVKRPAVTTDLVKLVRIADRLDFVRVNGGLVTPQEIPGKVNDWYTWASCIKNSVKHITGGVLDGRCVRDSARMAALACGGEEQFRRRPSISGWVLTLPPLGIDPGSLEALVEMASLNIPAIVSSGPILGATSPVTMAGTIAQAHAEILACLVVSQLTSPGAPFVYTSFARGMDMRSGNVSMAGPEFAALKVAMAQMGRSLELPIRMPAMLRDAKTLDAQAGFETGMVASLASCGADIMDSMQLDMDIVVDYADLVFCNECMTALNRFNKGVTVGDDHIALEVIRSVGPGGTYLAHEHTMKNFRDELWHPELLERRNWERWEADGSRDIRTVSLEKCLELMELEPRDYPPPPVRDEIDRIVEQARLDYEA